MRSPSRHSVWIDVFGIVLVGAVLLGGAGYLLVHAGGTTSSLGGGVVASNGERSAPPSLGGGLSARRPAPNPAPSSLLEGDRAVTPSGSRVDVPFSESWREQATPDLAGPTGSGGVPSGGGTIGGGTPEAEGPTIALRWSPSGTGSRSARTRTGSEGSAWRAEARQLSGRARALSNQLGQMERAASEEETRSSREVSTAKTSGGGGEASASSGPGTPEDPNQVPIGGLEWLAAAGVVYALRRLGLQSKGQ